MLILSTQLALFHLIALLATLSITEHSLSCWLGSSCIVIFLSYKLHDPGEQYQGMDLALPNDSCFQLKYIQWYPYRAHLDVVDTTSGHDLSHLHN